jgi:tetratricopeptide (TPR) repeat protein/TolB-like protein
VSADPPGPRPTRTNTDPVARLTAGTLLAGRYRIGELLGVGGMGLVYAASDETLGVPVAVKALRPELSVDAKLMERFRRELILGRQVSHPNVVRIHDIGRDGTIDFLTMDLVRGRSLREIIADGGKLDEAAALAIVRQLAEALGAAHAAGVVHRDLKPSNVLVDADGKVHVTDFGIARSLSAGGLTRTGEVIGTLEYLSPEQARGEAVDARTDIYALGVILFEMLTGHLPFAGGSSAELLAQRIAGKRRDLSEYGVTPGAAVRDALARCLATSPPRRYATTAELLEALAHPERARRRRVLRRALAAAALVVAALGIAWGARGLAGRVRSQPASPARPASIAVLPFRDETGSPALAWTASGLAEMLASALAQSPGLAVVDSARVARTIEDLKLGEEPWSDRTLARLGEIFNVDRLVVGASRTSDGRELRVDGRLVTLGPGDAVASTALAEAGREPGALIEGLSRTVRAKLDVPAPAALPPVAKSPEAQAAYERGTELLRRGDALLAIPELESAVAADPGFAAAWQRLSEACDGAGQNDRAVEAADRAVAASAGTDSTVGFRARAQQAMLGGHPDAAEGILRELVKRYPGELEAAVSHAEALAQGGQLAEAMAELQRVTQASPNHPRAWYLLGKFSILSGDSRKAVDDYLVHAMVVENILKSDQGKADVLNAFGVGWRELGDLKQAEENYVQASELRQKIGDRRGYATTLRNLAQIRMSRGQQGEAEKTLAEASGIFQSLGDRGGVADTLNDLGVLEEGRGRNAEALKRYREALQIRREVGDRRGEAESLNNVGYAYQLLGESDNASAYWTQSLALHRETGNREGVVLVTQSLGQLQMSQGHWDLAAKSLLAALQDSREMELRSAEAASEGYLGRLAQYQGRYAAALSSYAEALSVLDALKDTHGLAEFTLARAEAWIEMNRLDDAEADLSRAAGDLTATPNLEQHAEWLRLSAAVKARRGDADGAQAALASARRELAGNASPSSSLSLDIDDGLLRLSRGGPRDAARSLASAQARADRLGDMPLRLRATDAAARGALAAGDGRRADALIGQALRWVQDCGSWSGTHRLYRMRATIERQRGEPQAAEASAKRAAAELDRMTQGLTPDQAGALRRAQEARS